MAKRLTKYAIVERAVNESQAVKISVIIGVGKRRMIWLDIQTANLLKKIFDNAPLENRTKLEALPWDRLVNMAWSACK